MVAPFLLPGITEDALGALVDRVNALRARPDGTLEGFDAVLAEWLDQIGLRVAGDEHLVADSLSALTGFQHRQHALDHPDAKRALVRLLTRAPRSRGARRGWIVAFERSCAVAKPPRAPDAAMARWVLNDIKLNLRKLTDASLPEDDEAQDRRRGSMRTAEDAEAPSILCLLDEVRESEELEIRLRALGVPPAEAALAMLYATSDDSITKRQAAERLGLAEGTVSTLHWRLAQRLRLADERAPGIHPIVGAEPLFASATHAVSIYLALRDYLMSPGPRLDREGRLVLLGVLRGMIDTLPEQERQALLLAVATGLPFRALAQRLGCGEHEAQARFETGRDMLAFRLAERGWLRRMPNRVRSLRV